MKSTLVLALLLALPFHSLRAAETITWPNPWKKGLTLAYETESLESKVSPGKREKSRTLSSTEVRIAKVSEEGFVQEWITRKPVVEIIEGDPAQAEMMRAAMRGFEGFAVSIDLDKAGNYVRIRNIDDVSARVRKTMKPLMTAGVDAGIARLAKAEREKARAEALKQVDGVLDRMTAPAVLENLIGRDIQTYNNFIGAELEADQWYELETELDNPTGGNRIPAKLQFALYESKQDPDDIFMEWKSSIDPQKGAEAAWAILESLSGKKPGRRERRKLPKEIAIDDEGFAMFRRGTGVIEMFSSTRTVRMADHEKVERERMRLTGGDHRHEWSEGNEATASASAK